MDASQRIHEGLGGLCRPPGRSSDQFAYSSPATGDVMLGSQDRGSEQGPSISGKADGRNMWPMRPFISERIESAVNTFQIILRFTYLAARSPPVILWVDSVVIRQVFQASKTQRNRKSRLRCDLVAHRTRVGDRLPRNSAHRCSFGADGRRI